LEAGAARAAALSRRSKLKREGGADYVRHFDDDDVDFGAEDRLDGQGGEAFEEELWGDEEALLREEQLAQEADNEAAARANRELQARRAGMSVDDAEEALRVEEEMEEIRDTLPLEEDELAVPAAEKAAAASRAKQQAAAAAAAAAAASDGSAMDEGGDGGSESDEDDEDDEDVDDDDLNLEDDEEEDAAAAAAPKKPKQPKHAKPRPALPVAAGGDDYKESDGDITVEPSPTAAASRKRPASPANAGAAAASAPSAAKRVKTEAGAVPAAGGAVAPGAAAGAPSPSDLAELQRLVILVLQSAPPHAPLTSKTLVDELRARYPGSVHKGNLAALKGILKRVVVIQQDKQHILLRKEFNVPV